MQSKAVLVGSVVFSLVLGCGKEAAKQSNDTAAADDDGGMAATPENEEGSAGRSNGEGDSRQPALAMPNDDAGQGGNVMVEPMGSAGAGVKGPSGEAGSGAQPTSNGGSSSGSAGESGMSQAGAPSMSGGSSGGPTSNGGVGTPDPVEPEPLPSGTPVAVAVGYGMRRVSSRDGIEWESFEELTPDGGDDNDLFRGLAFGAGRFVAVGGSSMSLTQISTDGRSWAPEDRGQDAWLGGVAFFNDDFVAAGGNGLRVHSEDLGTTWFDPVGYQPIHYRDVAVGNSLVVAVGHNYDETPNVGVIAITSDGLLWNEVMYEGDPYSRVAFGRGAFVATGANGRVSRSTDGVEWNDETVGSGNGSVVFVNGEFVVSNDGGVFRSIDGGQWAPVDGASFGVEGYIDGVYLSLGWPAVIHASPDMVQWEPVFEPGGSGFTRIVTGYVE